MKKPDLDRERSEEFHTLGEFLAMYNQNLPAAFPPATRELLMEFKKTHLDTFKGSDLWSLNLHRKKVMDWLPSRVARVQTV